MNYLLQHHTSGITPRLITFKAEQTGDGTDKGYGIAVVVDIGYGSHNGARDVLPFWQQQLDAAVLEYKRMHDDLEPGGPDCD